MRSVVLGLGWAGRRKAGKECSARELTWNQPPLMAAPGRRLLGARPELDGVAADTGTRVSDFLPSKDASSSTHSCSVSGIGRHG